jgi:hypothetical protein
MIFTKTSIGNRLDGLIQIINNECPADNGRFGASGAVCCRKIGTIFVRNFFVGMEWKPPPRQYARR